MDNVKKFANTAGENPRRQCAKMGLSLWLKKKWLVAQATPAIEVVLVAARGSSQLSPLPPPTPIHSQTSISFNLQLRRRLAFRLHLPSLHYSSFIARIYRATTLSPNLLEEDRAHSSLAFQSLH